MAEPISIQQLKDASEDAITLADFIYKPANVMIPRRLAADINSLQYYLDYMKSFAQRSYETYDEMVGNVGNLSENVSVFVTNDLDPSKNGIYTYNGNSFVKGEYQPENAAKDFVEAKLGEFLFDGKVRAQDVSTADGSTQEYVNTNVMSKLKNTSKTFDSVSSMIVSQDVKIGDLVSTVSYHKDTSFGGGNYSVVASGTGLADGFEYINGVGVQFKLDLKGQCDVTQAGARGINDSAAIMAAANIAKVRKIPLIAPTIGKMYQLNTAIDLMGIYTVHFLENINTSLVTDAIAVTVGGMANSGVPDIKFQSIFNGNNFTQPTPTLPVLRVFGAKSGTFEIGACNYVQIYADAAVPSGNSTAYNRFELNGVVRRLELYGKAGYSWINENEFHRGRIVELYVINESGYKNNHNLFSRNSFEGADVELKFINAWENRVEGARFEAAGVKGITFDTGSISNVIETTWTGQASPRDVTTPRINVTDNGVGNIVQHKDYTKYKTNRVIAIDGAAGLISDGVSVATLSPNVFPQKPFLGFAGGHLAALSIGYITSSSLTTKLLGLAEMIPVGIGDILRLTVNAVVGGIRPRVIAYDSNQKIILSAGLLEAPSYTYSEANKGLASTAIFPSGVTNMAVTSSQVAYVSLFFYSGSASTVLKSVYWDVLSKSNNRSVSVKDKSVMRLASPATSGIPTEGAVVYSVSDTAMYRASNIIGTNLEAVVDTSNPVIAISNLYSSYYKDGDVVGVLLDSGETHWGTVSDKTSTSFKAGALPSIASSGNRLVIVNWEKLTVVSTT